MASSSVPQRILANRSPNPQINSRLLQTLPPEIRSDIFSYALKDYEDPSPNKAYNPSTCYTRPSYWAPRKRDTALLRTCRAIYRECWFLPFLVCEQMHWLVGDYSERAPPGYLFGEQLTKLASTLQTIRAQQDYDFKIESLRIFAQMYKIEEGHLSSLMRTPELRPRVMVLTIRHTDWWYWEDDEPLRFEGGWIKELSQHLPSSVGEITIELESVQRKKKQIDEIARQMKEKWFFRRTDGVTLFASESAQSQWKGTSRWQQQRWTRDESSDGVIDYYIMSLTFRPEAILERRQLEISAIAREYAGKSSDLVTSEQLKLHNPEWRRMPAIVPPFHPEPLTALDTMEEDDEAERGRLSLGTHGRRILNFLTRRTGTRR